MRWAVFLAATKEAAIPRKALTAITMTEATPKRYMATKAASSRNSPHRFFTAFLLKSHTDLVRSAATATLIPARAFCTHWIWEKLPMNRAMTVMMMMEGVTMPAVATRAPMTPDLLKPMKVATFTAMIPGVDWPMA